MLESGWMTTSGDTAAIRKKIKEFSYKDSPIDRVFKRYDEFKKLFVDKHEIKAFQPLIDSINEVEMQGIDCSDDIEPL